MTNYTMKAHELTTEQKETLIGLNHWTQQAKEMTGNAASVVKEYYENKCIELNIGFNIIHNAKNSGKLFFILNEGYGY